MGLPQLESCCFVLDLKTGNIVMGGVNAFLSFIIMVMMIVWASMLGAIPPTGDPEVDATITGLYVMCIILVLMYLVRFCFDLFFIYGVIKERAPIIKAYFIVWTVLYILSIGVFFLNVSHFSTGAICVQLFQIGLNMYTIILSRSFYVQLNTREQV